MKKNYIDQVRQMDTEKGLFIVGIVMLFIGILIELVFMLVQIDPFTFLGTRFGQCPFYRVTGFFCPGCGGTRAFHAFIRGRFITSFQENAFVWYVMSCYVIFMMSQTICLLSKEQYKGITFKMRYIYLGVIILVIQWITKNVVLHMS